MTTSSQAFVTASAVCTPLGLTVPAVEAAVRAGIMVSAETAVVGRQGDALRANRIELLDPDTPRLIRMQAAAKFALDDLARHHGARVAPAVFLALPNESNDQHGQKSWDRAIIAMLNETFARGVHSVRAFPHGRGAFFYALQVGLAELASGTVASILVGGIDSLCDADTLIRLDEEGRLLGASPDGALTPGEGAGFVLIERDDRADAPRDETAAAVLAATTRREAFHFQQPQPNRAEALTTVFQQLRDHAPVRADLMYTCETGERFWTEELAQAYLRNGPLMPEPFRRTMQADAFGDLGAASGAVLTAVGIEGLARFDRPASPVLLVCGSSDDGHVGACLVQRTTLPTARPS